MADRPTPGRDALAELDARLRGDVLAGAGDRGLYAQDASPYRVRPAAVVRPRDAADCIAVVRWAGEHGVALIARGGGTGLAGQCVGAGVVVDTSRYMTAIDAADPDSGDIRVEPGVTPAALNRALAPHGRLFGPDPSTSTRATLGGMLGTNAWGPHAPVDGTTREQVVAVEAVLADGRHVRLSAGETESLDGSAEPAADGERRATLAAILERHGAALAGAFPRPGSGLCSNNGYPLYRLLDGPLDEALLFAGAEGTLGLVTALTLRTRPVRRARRVLCPHFSGVGEALAAVPAALAAGAHAVELLDAHLLALARAHPAQADNRAWLTGEPGAVLLIEFADGDAPGGLDATLEQGGAFALPVVTGGDVDRVWALRRAALGLLMGRASGRRAVTGLEDTAVPVERLAAYIAEVDGLFAAEGVEAVHYGSVSLGLVHLRPLLDLDTAQDRARYRRLLDGLAALVRRHGGVWSTKHGDGRLRSPWLERVLGGEAMAAMRAVKAAYDPANRFNPGKIVDAPDPLSDLRAGAAAAPAATGLDWADDRGLVAAAGRCQGAGACRQAAADGGMCPTYQATREERHATRGRANLFQQALTSADPARALAGDDLHDALALCLGCKACQHECPAQVDMARLKAEALYQRHRARGAGARARGLAAFADLAAVGARMPRLANALAASGALRRVAGLGAAPPPLARNRLQRRLRGRAPAADGPRGRVILALDAHTAYFDPGVGEAALAVITALGYGAVVSPVVSLGRPAISQGMLARAGREIERAAAVLAGLGSAHDPVIGLEPSEILTLRDEAPALVRDAAARARVEAVAGRALLFDEWLAGEAGAGLGAAAAGPVAVHAHCHARAAGAAPAAGAAVRRLAGDEVHVLRAGCCGMAGAFGYQHPAISRAVFDQALGPAVAALPPGTPVVAHGVSCRQQLRRLSERAVLHPAQWVAQVMAG